MVAICFAFFSVLKMEAALSSAFFVTNNIIIIIVILDTLKIL
jgi:hypothetical protein